MFEAAGLALAGGVVDFVQRHARSGDRFLIFDPATIEFYAGRDLFNAPSQPNASSRASFIASGSRQKGFPAQAQEVLDRLKARRQDFRAIGEYETSAYLFSPERRPGQLPLP